MTRKLPALLLTILFLTVVSSAYAVDATTNSAQITTDDAETRLKKQIQLIQEQKKASTTRVAEEAKTKIQGLKDEFKARLLIIKDQKKRTLVERIDAKLAEVNKNHTLKFNDVLIRLQGFLDKTKQLATDPDVLSDIAAAQTALDAAKVSVQEQATKAYTMEITDDATLKLNAGTIVSQLRQDLSSVHKTVIAVKQLVQKLNTDKNLIEKEATSSAR